MDAVLIIGEHGEYPKNEFGQTLYPRYEFFSAVTRVFRRSSRSVQTSSPCKPYKTVCYKIGF